MNIIKDFAILFNDIGWLQVRGQILHIAPSPTKYTIIIKARIRKYAPIFFWV